jgi:hypothetical protein
MAISINALQAIVYKCHTESPRPGKEQHVDQPTPRSRHPVQTCEAFSANRYPFPEDSARQRQMHSDVSARLLELNSTISAGSRRRDNVLEHLALSIESWITVVRREKAVYHTMNKLSFDVTQQALVAEAWAPLGSRVAVQSALQRATVASSATVGTIFQPLATHEQPPTYFKTTMFTECFHMIVEVRCMHAHRDESGEGCPGVLVCDGRGMMNGALVGSGSPNVLARHALARTTLGYATLSQRLLECQDGVRTHWVLH